MPSPRSLRWFAVSVFIVSSVINFLDRQLLSTLAPLILADFHLNQQGFGNLIAAFSIAYAAGSLATGWLLDRFGINKAISMAVTWWSVAAVSTGFAGTLPMLTGTRAALGLGESAGVSAVGKLNGLYLDPKERALGAALNGTGISIGLALAPLFIGVATRTSWRVPFIIAGVLGLLWIPVWIFTSRRIPPTFASPAPTRPSLSLLRDRNLLILVLANVLWMGTYSLWTNWTTLYLIHVHGITLRQSAAYVWIPPLISNFGAFFGGWLSYRWMSRRNAVRISAIGAMITLALPLATDARWATAIISASFFFALSGSVNIYALPIDIFGPARAGLTISALVFAYGLLQTGISPLIGYLGDHNLYTQVGWIVSIPMLLGALTLNALRSTMDYPNR